MLEAGCGIRDAIGDTSGVGAAIRSPAPAIGLAGGRRRSGNSARCSCCFRFRYDIADVTQGGWSVRVSSCWRRMIPEN